MWTASCHLVACRRGGLCSWSRTVAAEGTLCEDTVSAVQPQPSSRESYVQRPQNKLHLTKGVLARDRGYSSALEHIRSRFSYCKVQAESQPWGPPAQHLSIVLLTPKSCSATNLNSSKITGFSMTCTLARRLFTWLCLSEVMEAMVPSLPCSHARKVTQLRVGRQGGHNDYRKCHIPKWKVSTKTNRKRTQDEVFESASCSPRSRFKSVNAYYG